MIKSLTKSGKKIIPLRFGKFEEIPIDWNEKPLDDFLYVNMGQSPPSTTYNSEGNGLPFVQGVTEFGAKFPIIQIWCDKPQKISNKGEILFSIRAPVGELNISNQQICIGRGVASLKPKGENNLLYLFYLLHQFKNRFTPFCQGIPYDSINKPSLKQTTFPICEPKEQSLIAEIISNIENLIENLEKILENSLLLKQSIIDKLLSKGISHTTYEEYFFTKKSIVSLGLIPKEWDFVKINELKKSGKIIEIQDGNHGNAHPTEQDFSNQGIPFITADCISKNKIDFSICKYLPNSFLKKLRIGFSKNNDVLLSHKGSIGFTTIVDSQYDTIILSPQVTYYRVSEEILPNYLHYVFQSTMFKKQLKIFASQSTRDYVGITNQGKLSIPLPKKVQEQKEICDIIKNIDLKIDILKLKKSKLNWILKGVMQKLLCGEVQIK